jgi:AraC-like DNA-binding protein
MYDETDIFTELAPLLRVRPELKEICRFGAQWAAKHEPDGSGWAPFHIVTHGACLPRRSIPRQSSSEQGRFRRCLHRHPPGTPRARRRRAAPGPCAHVLPLRNAIKCSRNLTRSQVRVFINSACLCNLAQSSASWQLGRAWTLDELAERANTSRATLVRLFQKAVDTAPLTFLAELLLSVARHHVLATNTPLTMIADEVGYQSETTFSRAYHRRFGVAPGVDRKVRWVLTNATRVPEAALDGSRMQL